MSSYASLGLRSHSLCSLTTVSKHVMPPDDDQQPPASAPCIYAFLAETRAPCVHDEVR